LAILFFIKCSDKKADEQIVARLGDQTITSEKFWVSFHLYPKYRQNSKRGEALLQQLEYMIDRIYLTMAARENNLGEDPDIKEKIDYMQGKEKLKRLYEKNVLDKIEITKQEAWEEYKRHNIQIRLRHLFAKNESQAGNYYKQLQQGATFSEIAKVSFKDSVLANNGGDLGFVTITDLDPFLIDSVYNLRIGEISKPLRSSYGYHIILVEDLKQSAFLSQEYFQQNIDSYKKSLQKRRATSKSAEYVSQILSGKSVDINPSIFHQLISISKNNIANRRHEFPFLVPAITTGELNNIALNIDTIKDSLLVKYSGGEWTVAQFVEKLKKMPSLDRPVINREQEFIENVIEMVRDELLIDQANRESIGQDELFQENFVQWKNSLLAEEYYKRTYWVEYKTQNEELWQKRKKILAEIKLNNPAEIDTALLYQDYTPKELEEKLPLINVTLREPYIW
jgi:hypothetical protein